jgi:adenosylmethionine-8-amino-7-oxononanoate aminotransferase
MEGAGSTPPGWLAGLKHLWRPYAQMKNAPPPLAVAHTSGCRIFLEDGRSLIDGTASWWTACHGYNHAHIEAAVAYQLQRMPHVMMAGLVHEQATKLAARLAALLPGEFDHVFFSESGSVAVEIALKMAAQYWRNRGENRRAFVAFTGGYHGDTLGAMAVSDPATGMQGRLAGSIPHQFIRELPRDPDSTARLDDFLAAQASEIAAIVVEPLVQGAGGMVFHNPTVLKTLRALADRYGILLIFDEIFTGFGRTGTMFAMEAAGVVPDIVTLSKALTGGALALAATVASRRVYDGFLSDDAAAALMHGPTYMGNALACAAANASLDLFEREPRLTQVKDIERQLINELEPCRKLASVKDVRVKGAIGVVELKADSDLDELRRRFVAAGVWIRPFGRTVYLTPAFTITPDELSQLTGAMRSVLAG